LFKALKYIIGFILIIAWLDLIGPWANAKPLDSYYNLLVFNNFLQDTTSADSTPQLVYPFQDEKNSTFISGYKSGLYLKRPSNIQKEVHFDPVTKEYTITEKIGNLDYRPALTLSMDEYKKWKFDQEMRAYWRQRAGGNVGDFRSVLIPEIHIGGAAFDKIFGSNVINIVPQGSAELIFGLNTSRIDNPALSERLRKVTTFDFQEKIQMNVSGSIGDKVKLGINYNTEATFDFENETKLEFAGKEDEIIKKIQAGNITFPLAGTLITGSQSLFGLRTDLQFGKLSVSTVFSQQKGETSVIEVKGGAQVQDFEVEISDYESNKHFFLSQYFRDHYNEALQHLPIISTGVNIEKIEVWVTNKSSKFEESRNIAAFMDLAEASANIYNQIPGFQQTQPGEYPDNNLNGEYNALTNTYVEFVILTR